MADGSVIIDTELDQSGLKTGLSKLASGAIGGITTAITAATAAISTAGAYAVNVGSDFEAAISNVAATMGTTVDTIDEIKAKAQELGETTAFSATEAAEGFNILAQSGLSASEQLSAIDSVLNLAAAGEMTMADASSYVTTTMKAMSVEMDSAGKNATYVADIYAKGATLANTSTAEFGEAMVNAASVAGSYNQSLETTGTALLLLAEKGYQGSAAGTYLSRTMSDLYAPTANAQKALDALGVSVYDESGKQKDLLDVVNELNSAMNGLTEEEKAAYTGTIFTTAGLKGFNSIAQNSSEQIAEMKSNLQDCTGAAQQMAETKLDNLQGDLTILKSATEGFGIALYSNMQEPLRDFVQEATSLVDQLHNALSDGGLSGMAEAMGGVLSQAVAKIAEYAPSVVEAAVGLIESFVSGLSEAAPKISEVAVSIVSSLVTGIMSVSTQLMVLAANLIASFAQGIVDAIPSLLESVITFLEGWYPQLIGEIIPSLLDAAVEIVQSVVDYLPDMITMITEALPELLIGIIDSVSELLPKIIECAVTIVNSVVEALPELIAMICEALPDLITGIVDALLGMIPQIVECGTTLLTSLIQALPQIIYTIVAALPQIIAAIIETLGGLIPEIITCGIELLTSLIANLDEIIITIVAVIPQIIAEIISALVDNIPLLIQTGIDLFCALIEALPEIIVALCAAAPTIIRSIIDALISNIPNIINCGIKLLTSLITALPQIIATLIKAMPQIVQSIVTALGNLKNKFVEVGKNLFLGLGDGIKNAMSRVLESALNACKGIVSKVKNFFGIASPSKLFRNVIGKNLMLGIEKGIEDEENAPISAAAETARKIADAAQNYDIIAETAKAAVTSGTNNVATEMTTASEHTGYRQESDESGEDKDRGDNPKYVYNVIEIDGREAAKVITPYVSKELEWEGM